MKIQEVLDKTTKFFRDKSIESARLDAELLISSALGLRRIDLYLKFDQPLREEELEKCRGLVKRRTQGEPVAYILQRKEFFGFDFLVDSRVLIPRPETETLVELAADILKRIEKPRLVDFGCGSGCIGLSLLKLCTESEGVLIDASADALEVTRINADTLGVADRAQFLHQRAQDFNGQDFDLVLGNPPYISPDDPAVDENVRKFEPASALFADENGTQQIREWADKAFLALRAGGVTLFEIGASQGEAAKNIFAQMGFQNIRIQRDLSDRDRIVIGHKA